MTHLATPAIPTRRGGLRIADRVYCRIAAAAAREALADAWAERGRRGAMPNASVLVVRAGARLTVHVELPFPTDIAALAVTAREAVTTQVTALTGTPVADVTIIIDRLVPAGPPR